MKKDEAVPFDAVAKQYDQTFTETLTGRCQRGKVYDYILRQGMLPGNMLELNCGTGEDAVWWAKCGWQVIATDISGEMVAQTRNKIQKNALENKITAFSSDAVQIAQHLSANGFGAARFQLVFSNFGGINCLSPEALGVLAEQLRQLITPGGKVMLVVMGRFCWWETVYFLLKGRFRTAFRRLSEKPVDAGLGAGTTIKTWYYSPGQIERAFAPMRVELLAPVGFWAPPSYLDPLMQRFPTLFNALKRWEKVCTGKLWVYGADHYLIQVVL